MSDPFAQLNALRAPSQDELTGPAQRALTMAGNWKIEDDETYSLAADELRAVKAKAKALEEQRTAITTPMNAALRAVNALFKKPAEMLEQAEKLIKREMIGYSDRKEQERIAAERAAREAEERRIAAEVEARLLETAGEIREESIHSFDDAAIVAAASVPVVDLAPKVAGISKVKVTLKARVTDKAALLAHIAQAPAYMDLADINESRLNTLVRALGAQLQLPGVELYEEKSIAARAA